mgnify:CR=1 FL=1|jgi:hypothetical protein
MTFRSYDLLKLVQDHGEELTLRKKTTAGTYDPATGSVSGSATTDYVVDGYFFNFSVGLPIGDEVRRGSRRCVLPALGLAVEPDDEDLIIGQGDNVSIVSVNTIFSGGSAVCYICEVRE